MELFKKFKTIKEEHEKSLQYALHVEQVAARLGTSLDRAADIMEGKAEVTLEEAERYINAIPGVDLKEQLEEVGIRRFQVHDSGKLSGFVRRDGEKIIRDFGLEDEAKLKESYGRRIRSSRFTPYSTRAVKLLKNESNTVHYGIFTEPKRFVVARWLSETNEIKTVDQYTFEGSADSLEGKAALAKALLSVETHFKKAT
jgi:hypothetical protein